ncbi:MAG: DMT family transporter [Acidimicrobiia bacterium]
MTETPVGGDPRSEWARGPVPSGPTGSAGSGTARSLAGAAVVAFALGLNFILLKIGLRQAGPVSIQAIGALSAFVVLSAVCVVTGRGLRPNRDELRVAGLMALLFSGVASVGSTAGLANVNAFTAALIGASTPVITALLERAVGRRRLGRGVWVGVAIGFGGVALVAFGQRSAGSSTLLGLVFLTMAAASWSITLILAGSIPARLVPLRIAGWQAGLAAPVLLVLALTLEGSSPVWGWPTIGASVYSGVIANGTSLLVQLNLVRRGSALQTSTIAYLVPIVAWVLAVELLNESPTPLQMLGAAGVLASVALITRRRRAPLPSERYGPPPPSSSLPFSSGSRSKETGI